MWVFSVIKRGFLTAVMGGAVLGASAVAVPAAVDPGTPDVVVDKGLAALIKLQAADGTFDDSTATTALAGIALLAGGSTPTRGRYHVEAARILHAILAAQDRNTGYITDQIGRMYTHGFATLYLAETYGMAPDQSVRKALGAAVDLIEYAQNQEGGWRYDPYPNQADVSVTVCEAMALRAAYNAGFGGREIADALSRAEAYVRRRANGNGTFSYQTGTEGGDGAEAVPRAAAGAMCLISAGTTDVADRNLGPALLFLRQNVAAHLHSASGYYWYGEYYAAQALYHSPDPSDWDTYWQQAVPVIVGLQSDTGQWPAMEGPGPAYGTAMALIILQIPNDYLPIFER